MARPSSSRPMTTSSVSSTRVLRSHTKLASQAAEPTRPPVAIRKRRPNADPGTKKRKQNPNPKPRTLPTHFTCRICIEEKPTAQFIEWVPSRWRRNRNLDVPANCMRHLARIPNKTKTDPVCKSCISNTMCAVLETLGARQVGVGCLEPGCTEAWTYFHIMLYMPSGAPLEKYNLEMFQVWKETADPGPMACLSPGCNAIGLPDYLADGYPQVACNDCSFRSCAQCRVPWHEGVTCSEYAAKHINDEMSDAEKHTLELMQSKDAKRCPHCQMVVEKTGGCDGMLCGGCHKHFNWAAAASAIVGAKKAEMGFKRMMLHYINYGPYVCEADGVV